MPEITAQLVKDLRDRTGASFIDCKNALNDNDGDMEKAVELLKIKGVAKATKKGQQGNTRRFNNFLYPCRRQNWSTSGNKL